MIKPNIMRIITIVRKIKSDKMTLSLLPRITPKSEPIDIIIAVR